MVRYHYQWILRYDFLPTVMGLDSLAEILPHIAKRSNVLRHPPQLKFYRAQKGAIPIEFSTAAYRFGHSMIRPSYHLNRSVRSVPLLDPLGQDLRGFRAFPPNWGVDWSLFLPMSLRAGQAGSPGLQQAYKIDTSLIDILGSLPGATGVASLAQSSLLRGLKMGLPSRQDVARAMAISPIPDQFLKIGRVN